ncbi:hypothetical protein ACJMK2_032209, partial [Sinanodonta woodiana]
MLNFALHKSAKQSTTLTYNGFNWTADKAVDGNNNGSDPDNSKTCSATEVVFMNHTWEVDLGVDILVTKITVYGRSDRASVQLDNVRLCLGNNSGSWKYGREVRSDPSNSTNNIKYVFRAHNAIARFISVMRKGYHLTICDVTVEGECIRRTYGSGCNETCGNCYKGDTSCSLTDGRCMEGCEAGWRGDTCKLKCEEGTYGFNCNETCGNCLNGNNSCSMVSGQCSDGCQTGWRGETCKSECDEGTYSFNCNETCGNCLNGNNSCSMVSGQCSDGCRTGWRGETCKSECEEGTYGFNCNETCGYCLNGNNSCSMVSGKCSDGCQTGWRGETCKSEGTYGINCNETCGNCLNGNNSCSMVSGQCSDGCQTGWRVKTCKSEISETVTSGDIGSNTNAVVGSVIAAVGVSICGMLIIIIIVKNRKKNNSETTTDNVTPATHYVNVVFGNPAAAFKMTVLSRAEQENTFSEIGEASLKKGMQPDIRSHNVYEDTRDVTESTEASAYSTNIYENLIYEQDMNTNEIRSNHIETLKELECALKSIEEEKSVLLNRKEKVLCKERERSRANKLRDMRKETDYIHLGTNTDYNYG